jgi:hypothetical protein
MAENRGWKVIGRGKNGWHADNGTTSLSGAYAEGRGIELAAEAAEGALVYDAKDADEGQFIRLVMAGPMCCCKLDPDSYDKLDGKTRKAALRMAPLMEGSFKQYALMAQNPRFGGLDQVGVHIYEGLLRQVDGMRIGHVKNGEIVWEEPGPEAQLELLS